MRRVSCWSDTTTANNHKYSEVADLGKHEKRRLGSKKPRAIIPGGVHRKSLRKLLGSAIINVGLGSGSQRQNKVPA